MCQGTSTLLRIMKLIVKSPSNEKKKMNSVSLSWDDLWMILWYVGVGRWSMVDDGNVERWKKTSGWGRRRSVATKQQKTDATVRLENLALHFRVCFVGHSRGWWWMEWQTWHYVAHAHHDFKKVENRMSSRFSSPIEVKSVVVTILFL